MARKKKKRKHGAGKRSANRAKERTGPAGFTGFDDDADFAQETDGLIDGEFGKQQQMVRQQDKRLGDMIIQVERIGQMGEMIGDELDDQADMLDDLDTDVDRAKDGMDLLNERMEKLIEQSGGFRWFCIIVSLVAVIIFLVILILL